MLQYVYWRLHVMKPVELLTAKLSLSVFHSVRQVKHHLWHKWIQIAESIVWGHPVSVAAITVNYFDQPLNLVKLPLPGDLLVWWQWRFAALTTKLATDASSMRGVTTTLWFAGRVWKPDICRQQLSLPCSLKSASVKTVIVPKCD